MQNIYLSQSLCACADQTDKYMSRCIPGHSGWIAHFHPCGQFGCVSLTPTCDIRVLASHFGLIKSLISFSGFFFVLFWDESLSFCDKQNNTPYLKQCLTIRYLCVYSSQYSTDFFMILEILWRYGAWEVTCRRKKTRTINPWPRFSSFVPSVYKPYYSRIFKL